MQQGLLGVPKNHRNPGKHMFGLAFSPLLEFIIIAKPPV
jgi:hypothetical protein